MLGLAPYYNRTIVKCINAFGSIFNNITLVKYTNDTQVETHRITVPLSYAGKENYITRLLDNPTLAKPAEITLPRMAFELASLAYDPSRKLSTYNYNTAAGGSNNNRLKQYQGVPYNMLFDLSLYVRNQEEGFQIVEQILPFFTPQYTPTINYIPEMGISRNAPITLNSTNYSVEYEGDAKEEVRTIIWQLQFTMQAMLYGPVSTGSVITSANTNFFYWGDGPGAMVEVFVANTGLSDYQIGETVYQGPSLPESTTQATVSLWDSNNSRLVLANVSGVVEVSANLIGSVTGASWAVMNTTPDILLVTATNTVVPNTANAQSDFVIDTTITEFPATITGNT